MLILQFQMIGFVVLSRLKMSDLLEDRFIPMHLILKVVTKNVREEEEDVMDSTGDNRACVIC